MKLFVMAAAAAVLAVSVEPSEARPVEQGAREQVEGASGSRKATARRSATARKKVSKRRAYASRRARGTRTARRAHAARTARAERAERRDYAERAERREYAERAERSEYSEGSARTERRVRNHRTQRSARRAYRGSGRYAASVVSVSGRYSAGPRPSRWCGWWMRTQRGGGPELNLAWNWSRWGRPSGPQVGAVVVWRRHVGEITGRASNGQWIVRSGNDGGRVRERPRSVAGAIFRM